MSSESPSDRSSWPVAGIVLAVEQHQRRLEHLLDELDTLVVHLEDRPDHPGHPDRPPRPPT